ncbi:MAG: ACT domain-containing protein [Clostridia bacterium]
MLVNQIAVFLENRSGRIAEFAKVLKNANINIQAMSIADTEEYGILRAITDNNALAIETLRANGFNTAATDLLGFEVPDKPGEMHRVLSLLDEAKINIGYLYSFSRTSKKSAIILIKVDDNDKTEKLLTDNGINLVSKDII